MSNFLSKEQMKLLKKAYKDKIYKKDFDNHPNHDEILDLLDGLADNGYLEKDDLFVGPYISIGCNAYKITTKGKATVELKRETDRRFRIPVAISVCAIVISVVSLVLSIVLR